MNENNINVKSVERSFAILEALAGTSRGLQLKDVCSTCGLPKSTAFRLLSCLVSMGYAYQEQSSARYYLSLRLGELVSRYNDETGLVRVARPFLEKLSETCGETVHLVVHSGNEVLYVFKTSGKASGFQMSSRVGSRMPMYCTAVGKVLLSSYGDDEVSKIWSASEVIQYTPNTITNIKFLQNQLEEIRLRGYAVDREENEMGICCIAFPIKGLNDRAIAAFSISGLAPKMTDEYLEKLSAAAKETRHKIELASGFCNESSL